MTAIRVSISPGELIDKIAILEIKLARFTERAKVDNVQREATILYQALAEQLPPLTPELRQLRERLHQTNQRLWDIEDEIRDCEARGDFGDTFIGLARSVYKTNDLRAQLKREINHLLGATLKEEKQYPNYSGGKR